MERGRRKLPRSGYPRRRAITACSTCRERKKKCDNTRPACSFCQQIGAQCDYGSRDSSSYDAASLTILNQLSVIESIVRRIPVHPSPNTPWPPAAPLSQQSATGETRSRSPDLDANYRVGTDDVLEWPVFEETLASLPRHSYTHFYRANAYTYLDDAFHLPEASNSQSLQQTLAANPVALSISTERSDIERLVGRFFQNVHVKNPILDRHSVLKYCQAYYEHGALFNLETGLVLIICALGAVATSFDPSSTAHQEASVESANMESLRLGRCYFAAAEKRLGVALVQPSTLAVQCLCLAGIYQMYTINPMSALRLFHAAGSSLQLLIATNTNPSDGTLQLGSSLCWTCFKSEREILAEIPVAAAALSELGTSEHYPGPPQAMLTPPDTSEWANIDGDSWYFFLSEIALRRLTDKVAEVVASHIDCSSPPSQQTAISIKDLVPVVAELERQVHTWRENLPPQLQFPDVPQAADTEWKHYSRSRYYRVLELMFRPFLFTAIHVPECEAAVRYLAGKSLASASQYLAHCATAHRHQGLWLKLRNQLREACILLAAAIAGLEMPPDWYAGIERTVRSFRLWEREYPPCQSYLRVVHVLIGHLEAREGDLAQLDDTHSGSEM